MQSLEQWFRSQSEPIPNHSKLVGLDPLAKALVVGAQAKRSDAPILVAFGHGGAARDFIDNLRFFLGTEWNDKIHYLPAVDFDYHRGLLPNPATLCDRNTTLFHVLENPTKRIFVTPMKSLLQKVFPAEKFLDAVQVLKAEQELDRDKFLAKLSEGGYQRQPSAVDPGVFALRGGVIDVFSPLYQYPFRCEFFGDFIEEMRFFDPSTQRSLEKIDQTYVIPTAQTLLPSVEEFNDVALRVKERLDEMGVPKLRREEILQRVREHESVVEFSLLFPLLSGGSQSPLEYFPSDMTLFIDDPAEIAQLVTEQECPGLNQNFDLFEKEITPIASRQSLFVPEKTALEWLATGTHFIPFAEGDTEGYKIDLREVSLRQERETLKSNKSSGALLASLAEKLKSWMSDGTHVNLVCHTRTHADNTKSLLEPYGVNCHHHEEGSDVYSHLESDNFSKLHLWQGYLSASIHFPGLRSLWIREEELFGAKKRSTGSKSKSTDSSRLLSSFRDVKEGDLMVHKDHGIGRYMGLKSMTLQGVTQDFVAMEYRDKDKLYVPVYRLNVLQKYVGGEGVGPPLDKLGGERWLKAKRKAKKAIAELAAGLLKLHAQRKMVEAHPYSPVGEAYREFEMEFPYDETPDQMRTIDELNVDLSQPHPMDRLVCGDVGYGKTEVAMRGAYRALLDKKQVAVLVPTTVLAFQHFESFKKRFESTGARVEMISRLRSTKEVKKTLELTAQGKVDILIGTHRIFSSDVKFADLGLVVVDEEHRFGVAHKEKIKKMGESVHLLSMTATPIPRTLNMAMTGIKDISVITTPPPDRLAVRTFVCRRSPEVLLDAVRSEIRRGGQVYFVHNRIQTQAKVLEELRELVPEASVEVAHGQMEAGVLEKKMLRFYQGEAQILLTTTIIESGLDISKANTMIIDRADQFGLAQLYQLRGRVGRSEKRAFCYLLVPPNQQLTQDAKERLQVIQRYSDLGSGFHIASHDLEIRGAGDLLGKDQSGHLAAIGVDYYFELLEDCMRELKGQHKRIDIEPEINLKVAAFIPDFYIPDISERISLYRKLSSVEEVDDFAHTEEEIRDRFGSLPEEVVNLLGLMRIKLVLKRLHVVRMGCGPKKTSLQFAPTTPANPEKLVGLVQKHRKRYAITPDQKLVITVDETDWNTQLKVIQELAIELGVEVV